MKYRGLKLATALASILAMQAPAALASSHREAPGITKMPKVDGTDFYMFRSYEPGRAGFVTLIANYQPFQLPVGGPNYYTMDPNAIYEIHIDNTGSGTEELTFQFKFTNTLINNGQGVTLNVGGKTLPIALRQGGQVTGPNSPNLGEVETYTLNMITGPARSGKSVAITNAAGGGTVFTKPLDNIGQKTEPQYASYVKNFIYNINIPGCATPGRVFAGQREEAFAVNVGESFDLVNYVPIEGDSKPFAGDHKIDRTRRVTVRLRGLAGTQHLRPAAERGQNGATRLRIDIFEHSPVIGATGLAGSLQQARLDLVPRKAHLRAGPRRRCRWQHLIGCFQDRQGLSREISERLLRGAEILEEKLVEHAHDRSIENVEPDAGAALAIVMIVPAPSRRQHEVVIGHRTALAIDHGAEARVSLDHETQRRNAVAMCPGELAGADHLNAHIDGRRRPLWEAGIIEHQRAAGGEGFRHDCAGCFKKVAHVRPLPEEGLAAGARTDEARFNLGDSGLA